MDLSIIIINYNCGSFIKGCLETITEGILHIRYEIIIVDNQSTDDSKNFLLSSFTDIKWIEMNYNAGFARANNAGIKQAKAPVILLLNPDTLVQNNAIENCYNEFIKDESVACGIQLLNPDGSSQISGNYAMTGGLNYLLPLPFLGNLIKYLGHLLKVNPPNIPDTNTKNHVDWINGAFLMVKKPAIEKAGMLDEDFFLYAEEAEWCSRLRKIGKLSIFGQFKVIHLQGSSANKTFGTDTQGYQNLFDRKGLQIMLSNLVRIRKEFGSFWFILILLIYILEIPIFIFGTILLNILGRRNYNSKMIINYIKNVLYVMRLTRIIITNERYFYKVL